MFGRHVAMDIASAGDHGVVHVGAAGGWFCNGIALQVGNMRAVCCDATSWLMNVDCQATEEALVN